MGKVVVFTSGFFDPIHRGHVRLLKDARLLGDRLVVGVHRDECCVRKKGFCFMPLEDRLEVLKAMKWVDEVVVCSPTCDLTSVEVLRCLKPNVFAKGGDRVCENMPRAELEVCDQLGIRVVYGVGGGKVQSSSWLVANIKRRFIAEQVSEVV
ncbi:MAG: adenylyltransferase/cytidyltransferase family protein [Nitrososphaerales archaeon]